MSVESRQSTYEHENDLRFDLLLHFGLWGYLQYPVNEGTLQGGNNSLKSEEDLKMMSVEYSLWLVTQ